MMNNPIDQFIQGQRDCREGIPAQSQDEAYISGYGFQYQCEQVLTHKSELREQVK